MLAALQVTILVLSPIKSSYAQSMLAALSDFSCSLLVVDLPWIQAERQEIHDPYNTTEEIDARMAVTDIVVIPILAPCDKESARPFSNGARDTPQLRVATWPTDKPLPELRSLVASLVTSLKSQRQRSEESSVESIYESLVKLIKKKNGNVDIAATNAAISSLGYRCHMRREKDRYEIDFIPV